MDMDKLKQWLEIAKDMQGGDFWNNIFDQDFAKQFMNDQDEPTVVQKQGQRSQTSKQAKTFPLIDLYEGEGEVLVLIEVPGVNKENVELGLKGNVLTVKGKVLPVFPHLTKSYSERFNGEFQRQITLPDPVSPSQLQAKYWNGLLFVSYKRVIETGEEIPIE